MPEGHSIRIQANYWGELVGQRVRTSSPQGRFDAGAELLDDSTITETDAHGKHLFVRFGERWLRVHLGLYGGFRWHDDQGEPPDPVGAIRLRTVYDNGWVDLVGPTACEVITDSDKAAIHARLGPDPLRPGDTIDSMRPWLRSTRWTIGAALMAQDVIAGIGNVYRAEVLFRSRIDPWRECRDVSDDEVSALWDDTRVLMLDGVKRRRIITTTQTLPGGNQPPRSCAYSTFVYKRDGQPCLVCGDTIVKEEMANRWLYRCPTCQAR